MNGMDRSRQFFFAEIQPLLTGKAALPQAVPQLVIGLFGRGSECFGFDDALSEDHDFGTRLVFCTTTQAETSLLQHRLQPLYEKYQDLLCEILTIDDFYLQCIGRNNPPSTNDDWLTLPDACLAQASNGEIFFCTSGPFSAIRETLLAYYPDDVRLKRLSYALFKAAQSGQYNYSRLQRRHETVAAQLALAGFALAVLSILHLSNRTFMPYYKWAHASARRLSQGKDIAALLQRLSHLPPLDQQNNLLIEEICQLTRRLLQQEFTLPQASGFLLEAASALLSKINDRQLREQSLYYCPGMAQLF